MLQECNVPCCQAHTHTHTPCLALPYSCSRAGVMLPGHHQPAQHCSWLWAQHLCAGVRNSFILRWVVPSGWGIRRRAPCPGPTRTSRAHCTAVHALTTKWSCTCLCLGVHTECVATLMNAAQWPRNSPMSSLHPQRGSLLPLHPIFCLAHAPRSSLDIACKP